MELAGGSQKRWHPFLREWVILAPATGERPWNGARVAKASPPRLPHDPGCHLCPGVSRASGAVNPEYPGTWVFDNDFAALHWADAAGQETDTGAAQGICRVACFSPRHDLTLAEMSEREILGVLRTWAEEYRKLRSDPRIEYVMQFENKGREIGVSNLHPHGQIYATDFIPKIPQRMCQSFTRHHERTGRCLLCELAVKEGDGPGRVERDSRFVAYVPSFARFKYEVHLVPIRHVESIADLDGKELEALARMYRRLLRRYDYLFQGSAPNITVFYNAPCHAPTLWHFHVQFSPPWRSPDQLKYLAGFETGGGNIINPSLPERAAEELRNADPEAAKYGGAHA